MKMKKRTPMRICLYVMLALLLSVSVLSPASAAYKSTTLRYGSTGEEVRQLQQALIDLGYLGGVADGIFGNNTENAVRKFQRKNGLTADGLAGVKTRELVMSKASGKPTPSPTPGPRNSPSPAPTSVPDVTPVPSGKLFGGNYATIRIGNRGDRVRTLQQALITLRCLSGSADGIFGKQTLNAVMAFQRSYNLTADGLAGKKTLTALENVLSGKLTPDIDPTPTPKVTPTPAPATPTPVPDEDLNPRIDPPSVSSLQLLRWYDDVKPSVSNGQQLLIYDPSSGLSWTLRIMSRGRHCDSEPLTARDTRTMVKAFGGVNTWNQKPVYVRLPDGRWTIGSTHDMPHDSGSIKNNDFNGHLCVHFLRPMEEAKKNDPNYGVANQETIRAFWKKLTGQEITDDPE